MSGTDDADAAPGGPGADPTEEIRRKEAQIEPVDPQIGTSPQPSRLPAATPAPPVPPVPPAPLPPPPAPPPANPAPASEPRIAAALGPPHPSPTLAAPPPPPALATPPAHPAPATLLPHPSPPPPAPPPANPALASEPRIAAALGPPSADVAPVGAESTIPGRHRGGFERWPTAPVGITPIVTAPDPDAPVMWAPIPPSAPSRGMSAWALTFGILALALAMVVGWGFPLGISAIVTAIIALRRPLESRGVAVWGLVLGAVSLMYSAGWLLYAATRTDLFALMA